MKVFVTGGTGYVGSAVVKRLLAEGHEVRCLVRENGKLDPLSGGAAGRAVEVKGNLLMLETYREARQRTSCGET